MFLGDFPAAIGGARIHMPGVALRPSLIWLLVGAFWGKGSRTMYSSGAFALLGKQD